MSAKAGFIIASRGEGRFCSLRQQCSQKRLSAASGNENPEGLSLRYRLSVISFPDAASTLFVAYRIALGEVAAQVGTTQPTYCRSNPTPPYRASGREVSAKAALFVA